MGHRKGRSKAETIEVKIERRCSSKEPATIVSNYEDKLNGDSVPSSRIIGRSVLRRLQIVAKLNIVTHTRARARTLHGRSINGQPRETNMYTRAERNPLFKIFIEAGIHEVGSKTESKSISRK